MYRDSDYKDNRQDELYSQAIPAGKRRYFFDVKATRGGDKYVTITESRKVFNDKTGDFTFEKSKLFLYKEDFEKFSKGLQNAFSFIETGIQPPPVVDEREFGDRENNASYDDSDLKF